ncbi:hypothetical protein [Sphingomonas sp. STIS6.2]|uniref:hypothetical protein n=1 Tax=Sphingomonas sp. STIS6.2 TaxID=1379700 RepID=UPI0004DB75A1|nr:hypothetical protein [Sphingomonas sp. STIS6.2]
MAKALKTAALVVGAVALVATGVGAVALPGFAGALTVAGISTGTLFLVSGGLTVAASLLQKTPKVPASQTDRLSASVNPGAFRHTVLGQTAMPVEVRYEEWSGKDQEYCDWIVLHASHACEAIDEIWFETTMAWSRATGVVGKYVGYFTVPHIILDGSPANAFTLGSGKWNRGARLTGCAYSHWRFKLTGNSKKAESPFVSGMPSRITVIGRGAKLYDPRRDSTVPGGNGPMRADDQSTWRFTTDDGVTIGENLPLQILRVVLGWRIRNPSTGTLKLATGSGVPPRRINLASIAIAANLADEMVNRSAGGQEPRYHGAGVVSEGDDPKTVLDMLCTACCARFRDTGGKLSLVVAHNDLAAAATEDGLNDDDVVGAFTWDPDAALEATPNVVRGKYVDATANSLYQLIDYPEIRLPSLDGQDRIFPLDLGVVESPSQAQRIAKQILQRKQYPREFSAPFDIRAWKYGVGDVVPFTFAALGFDRALFRIKDQELGQGGVCNMTLTVENAAIYAWDADDAAPVQPAEPIVYDSRNNPLILAIDEAATTAEWDSVTDPTGTKPDNNADVTGEHTSKDTNAVGGKPADAFLEELAAAQAYQNDLNNNIIPAINAAVTGAGERIEAVSSQANAAVAEADRRIAEAQTKLDRAVLDLAAEIDRTQGVAEDLTRRVDAIAAGGTGPNGEDVQALIERIDLVRADGDSALATAIQNVATAYEGLDAATNSRIADQAIALSDARRSIAQRIEEVVTEFHGLDAETNVRISQQYDALSDADEALARQIETISASGGYDDTEVRSEIRRVDTAAIERDSAAAQSVTEVTSSLSRGGGNLLSNTDFVTTDGWSENYNPSRPIYGINIAGAPYHPVGENVLSIYQAGRAGGADAYADWISDPVAIVSGSFVQFSAMFASHRADTQAFLGWVGSDGVIFEFVNGNRNTSTEKFANDPNLFKRSGLIAVQAPLRAVAARLLMRKNDTYEGQGDSYAWFWRPYIGAARQGQNSWNDWSPGSGRAIQLRSDAAIREAATTAATANQSVADLSTSVSTRFQGVNLTLSGYDQRITSLSSDQQGYVGRTSTLEAQMSRQAPSALNNFTDDVNNRLTQVDANVNARIKFSEDVLADLPNRYAAASRTATLEAQFRQEVGSPLNDAVNYVNGRVDTSNTQLTARIEERATAIADAKAGAVAQTLAQLRAEYNGSAATIAQQTGAIAGIDGRTSVFWSVTGTTPDGSTQISLSKSDGSAGVFYIGANLFVDGNAIFNGTVTIRALDRSTMTATTASSVAGSYGGAGQASKQYIPNLGADMFIRSGGSIYIAFSGFIGGQTNGTRDTQPTFEIMNAADNGILATVPLPESGFGSTGRLDNYTIRVLNTFGELTIRWRVAVRATERTWSIIRDPALSVYWTAL